MKFKTRLDNLMAKIAGESSAKAINAKTKEERLLAEISGLPVATAKDVGRVVAVDENGKYVLASLEELDS